MKCYFGYGCMQKQICAHILALFNSASTCNYYKMLIFNKQHNFFISNCKLFFIKCKVHHAAGNLIHNAL